VQQVLIQKGVLHARADGVFGPETREALISFQRQQGLQATGSIDTTTIASLGLSDRIRQNTQGAVTGQQQPAAQPNTTGQAPAAQQNTNPPAQQQSQSTTGQGQSAPSTAQNTTS